MICAVQLHVRQPQDDPVVAVHGLHVDPEALAHPGRHCQRPRRVDGAAVGRVHDDPPVAELVAEPLDQQGPVARDVAHGLLLLGQVGQQVVGSPVVQAGGEHS